MIITARSLRRPNHDIRCRAAKQNRHGPFHRRHDHVLWKHIPSCARCEEVQVTGACHADWRRLSYRWLAGAGCEGKDGQATSECVRGG